MLIVIREGDRRRKLRPSQRALIALSICRSTTAWLPFLAW